MNKRSKRPIQRFQRGMRVHIAKDLGSNMGHFTSDVDAIIDYSYADRYDYASRDVKTYMLLLLDKKTDVPCGLSGWYEEHQLTLVNPDILEGLMKFEEYKDICWQVEWRD